MYYTLHVCVSACMRACVRVNACVLQITPCQPKYQNAYSDKLHFLPSCADLQNATRQWNKYYSAVASTQETIFLLTCVVNDKCLITNIVSSRNERYSPRPTIPPSIHWNCVLCLAINVSITPAPGSSRSSAVHDQLHPQGKETELFFCKWDERVLCGTCDSVSERFRECLKGFIECLVGLVNQSWKGSGSVWWYLWLSLERIHGMVGGTCDSVLTGFRQCLVGLVTLSWQCSDSAYGRTCQSVSKVFRECFMILVTQSWKGFYNDWWDLWLSLEMVQSVHGRTCDLWLSLDGVQTVLDGTCDSVTKGFRECLMKLVAKSWKGLETAWWTCDSSRDRVQTVLGGICDSWLSLDRVRLQLYETCDSKGFKECSIDFVTVFTGFRQYLMKHVTQSWEGSDSVWWDFWLSLNSVCRGVWAISTAPVHAVWWWPTNGSSLDQCSKGAWWNCSLRLDEYA